MRRINFLILLWMLLSSALIAQTNVSVRGTVYDKSTNETMIGVSVRVDGTTTGTVTDIDGRFRIENVRRGSTLVFSYVGMKTASFPAGAEAMSVYLESDFKDLDEVVVVGYGTSRKRDLTGSIVSVSGESLKGSPDYNPIKALQGKVPGLVVTNSGAAGGSPTVRVRGVATTNADTRPLYVVDGMFIDNIDFVNPNDITSIEVLKDPSMADLTPTTSTSPTFEA